MATLLILGGGESGVGAALLAKSKGIECAVSDSGRIAEDYRKELIAVQIPFEEGGHSEAFLDAAQEVIKSPGVPPTAAPIKRLRSRNVPIISEVEFASRYLPQSCKLVAVTGSNGKTTTVTWLTHLLKKAGKRAIACGNVGFSMARAVLQGGFDYFVAELSSFQLEGVETFHPDVALLLNITPDHLDRYEHKIELYAAAKMRIAMNLGIGDSFIYWREDALTPALIPANAPFELKSFSLRSDKGARAYLKEDGSALCFCAENGMAPLEIPTDQIALPGKHNLLNAMAVGLAARSLGIPAEAVRDALHQFTNVPHRMEYVADLDDVSYINDSKATNIASTIYALEAQQRPVVLILGGTDKGNDYNEIKDLVLAKCRSLLFLGKDNAKLRNFFGNLLPYDEATSIPEAISKCAAMAEKGDVVLLSPCCASFDLFHNYEDRGDQFRAEVLKRKNNPEKASL